MHFAVYGTGGVGGYFGGRLAQAGQDVTFIARGEHLAAIQNKGLQVESILGDFTINPAQASSNPEQIGRVDVVIVAIKAWQVGAAAEHMRALLGPETIVVPLENGVDAPAELSAALGEEHILGGLCRISSFVSGLGKIRHVGVQPYIAFGERNGIKSERAESLRAVFASCAGLTVEIPENIESAMWDKFVFIASISGLGAVTRQTVGGFRTIPETRALLIAALEETTTLARARGVHLPPEQVKKTLAFIDNASPDLVASMQKDIMEGKPSELEAQNGAVVRMGRALGIPTPTHEFIYASLLPAELRARAIHST